MLVGNVNQQAEEKVNWALASQTKRFNTQKKCFSLHPLLITAAHIGVSFPWITAQSWSGCSPLPANTCVCVCMRKCECVCVSLQYALQHKMHLPQHGTLEKMTVLQVLFWQEAPPLPPSLLGPLMNMQFLLWGTGGRWRAGQTSDPTGPQQQVKMGQQCDDGRLEGEGVDKRGSALVLN